MKKWLSLILILCLSISLALTFTACGDDEDEDENENENGGNENDPSAFDYGNIDTQGVTISFDENNAFKTLISSYGNFDHTNPNKRAKLVLDALNQTLANANKADTEAKYTENTADVSFDKSRDIIYYCYYAVVSEGQEGAGKVVFTNYMSTDKAKAIQLGLDVEEDTLNASIYKIINDGHYSFDMGVYKTTTEGKVEEGDTIYISYTKSYETTVEGQTSTVTEGAVYHKLDASATGADKLFYDQLVEKERGFTNYKGYEHKITVESDDVTYEYSNYTIHFASEGNLQPCTAYAVKFGSTAEVIVDYFVDNYYANNHKVQLNPDTKLDYYIFPTHYVKTPEINATNIINLVFGSSISASRIAKIVFGENYYSAINSSDSTVALNTLYGTYTFDYMGNTLKLDEFTEAIQVLQEDLKKAEKTNGKQSSEYSEALRKRDDAVSLLINTVGADTIVDNYKFYEIYKSLESNYNDDYKRKLSESILEIIDNNVTVTSVSQALVDHIFDLIMADYEGLYEGSGYRSFENFLIAELYAQDLVDTSIFGYNISYSDALNIVKEQAAEIAKKLTAAFAVADRLGVRISDKELREEWFTNEDIYFEGIDFLLKYNELSTLTYLIEYQRELIVDEILRGYEIKSATDSNGYYATYYDYTRNADGSKNPYISTIILSPDSAE